MTANREAFLGIDLGTSSVKVLALTSDGQVLESAQERYVVNRPVAKWAEQDPSAWWFATVKAIRRVLSGFDADVLSVGLSGQMHGLVLVNANGEPLRPAIIWSDSRTTSQVEQWQQKIGNATVEKTTGMPIATGMAALSLNWLRDNEAEIYQAAFAAISPKDFIRFKLTGALNIEPTDAAGSLIYDIHSEKIAVHLLESMNIRTDIFPKLIPTLAIAGGVSNPASNETGLPAGLPVAAGGGDQAMAALGLGLSDFGRVAIAISSGGTVVKPTSKPLSSDLGLHVLPGARAGQWLAMGVVLAAGLGTDWLISKIFGQEITSATLHELMTQAEQVEPGAEGLMFAPNLAGTRTPQVNANVRGSIIGLGFQHGPAHIIRAYVEGVCIELNRSLESMRSAGEEISEIVISGGGARFALWRQTLSDVTGLPVSVSSDEEHSAMGAAFAGAIAIGTNLELDFSKRTSDQVLPDHKNTLLYSELNKKLQQLEATQLSESR
jgi:xylulokinase